MEQIFSKLLHISFSFSFTKKIQSSYDWNVWMNFFFFESQSPSISLSLYSAYFFATRLRLFRIRLRFHSWLIFFLNERFCTQRYCILRLSTWNVHKSLRIIFFFQILALLNNSITFVYLKVSIPIFVLNLLFSLKLNIKVGNNAEKMRFG